MPKKRPVGLRVLINDGYTGRNFNRPSFQRMIAGIEAGKVKCVIMEDLSRLGRNYIEAGSYIEVFFPRHNVRYIAVTDGVDSLNRQEMDITPFKNILNDMYSRDISRKVLAGRMTLSRQEKFCGGPVPLGLMRDPNDHGHLIVAPETAPIIRTIYDLASNGMGSMRIVTKRLSAGSNGKRIIDRRPPIMRGNNCPFYNLFHGRVYCATCGKSMQVRYENVGRTGKKCFTGEMALQDAETFYVWVAALSA